MTKRDYYDILGISKNASKEEIKKAYKKLAMKYHPDVSKEKDSSEKFKELSEAYAVLSDDQKRSTYNQFGHDGFDQRYTQEDIFRGFDFSSVFDEIFGESFSGDSIFDMFFGSDRRARRRKGNDLRYDLTIDFEDAAFGTKKEITINKDAICDSCNGTGAEHGNMVNCDACNGRGVVTRTQRTPFGMFSTSTTCRNCHGQGQIAKNDCKTCRGRGIVKESKKIKVTIPAGINNGQFLRLRGEGEAVKDGINGDLFVVVNVKPHKFFTRDENDLHLEVPISYSQAVLGTSIEVPTL